MALFCLVGFVAKKISFERLKTAVAVIRVLSVWRWSWSSAVVASCACWRSRSSARNALYVLGQLEFRLGRFKSRQRAHNAYHTMSPPISLKGRRLTGNWRGVQKMRHLKQDGYEEYETQTGPSNIVKTSSTFRQKHPRKPIDSKGSLQSNSVTFV